LLFLHFSFYFLVKFVDFSKKITKLPKSRVEIECEIPTNEWEDFLNEAMKELSRDLKVGGFRPGNIPKNIVEREIGTDKILARGVEMAVRKSYINAIFEEKIEAIGSPEIKVLKSAKGNPLVFKAVVSVLPEIKMADYKKIAAAKKPKGKEEIKIEEKEVEESLNWLLKSRTKYITVRREAKIGDRLEIDFKATLDGANLDKGESKNYPLILGQSRFVKGFDDNLLGLKEGEEKEFELMFPEDYQQKNLAGKLVGFKVKVNLVQEAELPQLNDEFVKSLGKFENLDKLKQNIEEGLAFEKYEKDKQAWREETIKKIIEGSKMELPEFLVEQEAKKMIEEMRANIEGYGLAWETYLKDLGKSEDELKQGAKKQAEKRVKGALILREIAKEEKIEIAPEEIEAEINKFLTRYSGIGKAKDSVDIGQLKEYTYGVLRNEKVFSKLEEISKNS